MFPNKKAFNTNYTIDMQGNNQFIFSLQNNNIQNNAFQNQLINANNNSKNGNTNNQQTNQIMNKNNQFIGYNPSRYYSPNPYGLIPSGLKVLNPTYKPTYNIILGKSMRYGTKLIDPRKIKKKEDERIEKIKNNMLIRQIETRKNNKIEKDKNQKINEVLEDMCIYGNITKDEIRKEKQLNPKKFVKLDDALNMKEKNEGLFVLGLLSTNLESMGIETAIEKDINDNDYDTLKSETDMTCLNFITNGFAAKKKYDLHFDFGEQKNEQLLLDENKYKTFQERLKLKLSKDYNIPHDKIIVTLPQRGSFRVQVIFQSDEFNELNIEQFKKKFKNDREFPELNYLKEIQSDTIMSACKLSLSQLDPEGNKYEGWPKGQKRGNLPYYSPEGWIGIGLNVFNRFENNVWLGMNNSKGEWCVAYHGVGCGQNSDKVKGIAGLIYKGGFKAGEGQLHKNCPDQFHPGHKVGEGVYCTDKITVAEKYAGIVDIKGQKYKLVIMSRVNPDKRRHCDICIDSKEPNNYWVVDGTTDDIRPYRILYKKVSG